jgi:hypothetical protein
VRRSGLAAAALAAGLCAGGCTVGDGSGSAVGMLMDVGCNDGNTLAMPMAYSLNPSFFAGVPIEDVCPPPGQCSGPRMNRLIIRMQRTGTSIQINDVLTFDVLNSLKVAQCVRGRTVGGQPTWDTREITAADGSPIPGVPWCDWNWTGAGVGGPDGGADAGVAPGAADGGAGAPVPMTQQFARINLTPQDFVTSSLAPLFTCVEARSVAVALPGSWILFKSFGTALQTDLPPDQRGTLNDDFKVDFGQRLSADFHLVLGDQAVEFAIKTHTSIPDQRISGSLDGSFDFDLDRGRAAQPFP